MYFLKEKLNFLVRLGLVILIGLTIASCVQSMEDSSSKPEYVSIIGQEFKVKEDLWALGITSDQNYKKNIDYIALVPGVGFSGPEVLSRDQFRKGAVIKVARILTSKSLFSSTVVYVVEEVGSKSSKKPEFWITVFGSISDPNSGLNNLYYERIE